MYIVYKRIYKRTRKTMQYTNRQDEPYKKNHEIYKPYQNNCIIQTDKINRVRKPMEYTIREIKTDKKNHAIYKPY